MARNFYQTNHIPRTLIVGIETPYHRVSSIQSYFDEFASLVKTNQLEYQDALFFKLRDIDPAYFMTKGKLETLRQACVNDKIERIVFSEPLTSQQERNLEDFLECTVIDRTRLILEIFEKAAHSAEGKTQVAIAALRHEKSRLAGKGIHLSQQAGATGVRAGAGETLKERERRRIDRTIEKLQRQLARMQQARATQRKQRVAREIPHICLVGYTNAGKSTILNTLTHAGVLAENKLFATLDTTTRELYTNGQKRGIISDTVGFIQQLPHHLIDAFKSTLSELKYADLLLHVIDLSDENWQQHTRIVHEILDDLGVNKQMLYVFNKRDRISDELFDEMSSAIRDYRPHVVICASSKEGIQPLTNFLASWKQEVDVVIPTRMAHEEQ